MKVAYVVSRFPVLTETFIVNELRAVEKQGIEVELFPLQRERAAMLHEQAQHWVERARFTPFLNMQVLRSNLGFLLRKPTVYLKTLAAMLWAARRSPRYFLGVAAFFPKSVHIAQQMEKIGVQHVHAHFASHPAAAALIIHRLTGIPYSFTAHGSDIHRDQTMLQEKTAGAARVVPISCFNKEVILRACGGKYAEKLTVIHCGVDTHLFAPVERQAREDKPVNILCIGTLHEVKGQAHLIEACRLLRERGLDFTCRFIGDGPDLPDLMQQVQDAGMTRQVVFLGRLDQNGVQQALADADILAAPSVPSRDGRREGIPVVLMEAMASSLPVVSSRLSGIPELVEDGVSGLLTRPGDSRAIADAVTCLAHDPDLRKRFGQAGRSKVEQEFDLDRSVQLLASLFRKERAS